MVSLGCYRSELCNFCRIKWRGLCQLVLWRPCNVFLIVVAFWKSENVPRFFNVFLGVMVCVLRSLGITCKWWVFVFDVMMVRGSLYCYKEWICNEVRRQVSVHDYR